MAKKTFNLNEVIEQKLWIRVNYQWQLDKIAKTCGISEVKVIKKYPYSTVKINEQGVAQIISSDVAKTKSLISFEKVELRYKISYADKLAFVMFEVKQEIEKAKTFYPEDFNSNHEGYAVALEEMDELWDEVKKKDFSKPKARAEAKQTAAMLLRMMVELF